MNDNKQERERELRERERERERERTEKDFSAAFLDNWTLEKKTQRKKKEKKREREKEREGEGERTCGARWLSCAFFENDVDTKKKKKRRMPCHGASLLIALQHTHTHTHAQCSLYNPKSPAPRSSPKLSPRSNNDPPSFRRRFPTAKVRFRKTEETTNHREPQKNSRKRWITKE